MRLSYHGWAAVLLLLSFTLAAIGIAWGITPVNVDTDAGTVTACGSPWVPAVPVTARCAVGLGGRGPLGQQLVMFGLVLFGGLLLVGMLVAGIRDALAGHARQAETPTAPPVG